MTERIGFEFFHKNKYWHVVEADNATGEHAPYWWCEDIDGNRVSFPDVILAHEQYMRDVAGFTPPDCLLYPAPQPAPATDAATKAVDADDLLHDLGVLSFAGIYIDKDDAESLRTEEGGELYNHLKDVQQKIAEATARAERAEDQVKRLREALVDIDQVVAKGILIEKWFTPSYNTLQAVLRRIKQAFPLKSEGGAG